VQNRTFRPNRGGAESDDFDADAISVCVERLDVGWVAGEGRAAWFGDRDDEGVDG
jgi:hypothetical protein